ncbi:LysR family transcriptional regulator [Vibrio tapetis subsp. quintayensis]|uniref:LysR family transcriptional regulator n=1 Tax=Vibrio tapetis TaxID=52443 RepID=UPI0025B56CF8|nr:LysR family transcriptional regulator [Vibrio tapetis]MDN3680996.1 LysR family transcriptional regulator [Vibrio tapetis subsp. quintayensis]
MKTKRVEQLMLFLEVAQQLSFSKAASELGISRSHLSEQIKRLENDLRTPLLIRTTRSVRLTTEGENVRQQALEIRNQVHHLERNLHSQNTIVSGVLKLTAPKMFAETVLLDMCKQFRCLHPEISFEINSSYQAFNLAESDIDVAFRASRNPPQNMVAIHLADYQHCLVAAPNYLEAKGTPTSIDELIHHECLTTLHQRLWELRSGERYVEGWLTTNDNRALRQLALTGEGIIRIARYYVESDIQAGALHPILPNETSNSFNSLYMVYPQRVYPSAKLKAFIEFAKQYCQETHIFD